MREEMEGEGVFFNPEDPPFHPWMLNFLTELKNECGNIFILSAGSGIQTGYDEKGEKNIEFTLMSNYARCWANAYNVPIFNVFGADPSLLSPSSSPYISPAALSFKNQIDPPEQQQKIISFLLAYLERKKQDLSSSSPSTSSSFYSQPFTLSTEEIEGGGEKMENVLCLVEKIKYFHFHGVIPVSGAKRDGMLRFLYHLFLVNKSIYSKKIFIYFVDDQHRYLKDVGCLREALMFTSLKRECEEFRSLVETFSVKTFRMPVIAPKRGTFHVETT